MAGSRIILLLIACRVLNTIANSQAMPNPDREVMIAARLNLKERR